MQFYKHDIVQWRGGTVGLSDRAYRVYHVLVEEIMLNEGPVPHHERSLAGKSNRSARDFRAALAELVAAGKVTIRAGMIENLRAEKELKSVRKLREHAAKGGRTLRERSANGPRKVGELDEKHNDNNGALEAVLHSDKKHYRGREEGRVEEERKAPLEDPPRSAPPPWPNPPQGQTSRNWDEPPQFAELWKVYPKRTKRRFAVRAFATALQRADFSIILAGAQTFRAQCDRDGQEKFAPSLEDWLDADGWIEHLTPTKTGKPHVSAKVAAARNAFIGVHERALDDERAEADRATGAGGRREPLRLVGTGGATGDGDH